MEGLPDTSTRRPIRKATKSIANREDHYRNGYASDQSPNKVVREVSLDDIEEIRPTKQGRALEATAASIQSPELSLIKAIKGDGKFIPQVVKFWVERYEKDANPAMAELLTMLFQACGAKYYHQGESLESVDDVVCGLVQLATKGKVEVYHISERKEFKNFKDNLVSLWDNLVVECQNGPLFDKVLFNKCMDYIIALARTPPRVYRQVASFMGFQLVTSFISVAKTLGTQRETTRLNAEKKKQIEGSRVESLTKRLSTTDKNIAELEAMMLKIFRELFKSQSYRDIDPVIRMSSMQYLGVWILSYPSVFLKAEYLQYLGWELNDKSADVRKACVLALQNLYEVVHDVRCLNQFTEKYSERMIEICDDIDVSVAVCAIGLVKQLFRHQLLPDAELHRLYRLLIADPPEIRRATGELVYDHLIAKKFNSTPSGSKGNDSESSEVHLRRMLEILRECSADPIFSVYVIDDVWEYMEAMKDWKCIISILLGDSLPELSDEDETNLIRLLFASAKKAVGERIVPASDNRKQYYNEAQKDVLENNRRDLTNAMMEKYPLLLRKFMADKAKVRSLVEIIVYMNLEPYSLKIQGQNFKTVLRLVKEVFFKHGEKDALRSRVKSFKFCSTESQEYLGPEIISHFVLHGTNVAEIVKRLITELRKTDDGILTLFLEAMKRVGPMDGK